MYQNLVRPPKVFEQVCILGFTGFRVPSLGALLLCLIAVWTRSLNELF